MTDNDMNEVFSETMIDSTVITVPIDEHLENPGEAADAYAVGVALSQKANISSVVAIKVNGEGADQQGNILIDGTDIPMSSTDSTTLKAKIEAVDGKTGADLAVSSSDARTVSEAIAEAAEAAADIDATTVMMQEGGSVSVADKIANMDVVANTNSQAISALQAKTANEIVMSSTDSTTVKNAIDSKVATVNGETPDATGNVQVTHALTADNLTSNHSQTSTAEFVRRAAGGGSPISTGNAWMNLLRGRRTHQGYSPASLTHSASQAPREEGDQPLSYTVDDDTFITAVGGATTTKTFTYTSSWSEDISTYGITAENMISGDQITVVYTAEARGTIYQSKPVTFVSTGWNLYNATLGYAIGIKYADPARFRVKGTYTAVKFSSTIDGAKTTITPSDGLFTISANGYIWVENTGGSLTDIEVFMTWSDWVEAADAPSTHEAYSESVIDMSGLFDEEDCPFPYGLLQVGSVQDEVNFNTGTATSKVERLAYSAENLATAEASGRTYEYDTNYIYLERATEIEYDLDDYDIDGAYAADDHGLEMFTGTTQAVYAVMIYGNNLKNKLEVDVLTVSGQTLTSAQQGQARTNIGAASQADLTTLNSNLTWKQVTTWTPLTPSATGTDFTEVSVPVLDGATEIIGFIGSSTNMFPLHLYLCGSAQNIVFEFDTHLLLSNNNYDYSVAFRYDKTNKKVGFRQSAKGSSASFQTLQEIWYR